MRINPKQPSVAAATALENAKEPPAAAMTALEGAKDLVKRVQELTFRRTIIVNRLSLVTNLKGEQSNAGMSQINIAREYIDHTMKIIEEALSNSSLKTIQEYKTRIQLLTSGNLLETLTDPWRNFVIECDKLTRKLHNCRQSIIELLDSIPKAQEYNTPL